MALGGAAGAVARLALAGRIQERLGGHVPWGTMAVNVSGCLVAGLVVGILDGAATPGPILPAAIGIDRALLVTGLLGAFTTFSGFAGDAVGLWRARQPSRAALYLLGSLLLGIVAAGAGLWAGRLAG